MNSRNCVYSRHGKEEKDSWEVVKRMDLVKLDVIYFLWTFFYFLCFFFRRRNMRRLGCVSSLLVSLVWARGEPIGRILFRFSPVVSVSAGRDSSTSISDLNLEQTGTLIDEATGRKMMQGDSKIEWIGQREFQRVKKKPNIFSLLLFPWLLFQIPAASFVSFPPILVGC